MPVKSFRPLKPSTRYITIANYDEITKTKPEKSLVYTRKKTGGRNHYGRVTSRGPNRARYGSSAVTKSPTAARKCCWRVENSRQRWAVACDRARS